MAKKISVHRRFNIQKEIIKREYYSYKFEYIGSRLIIYGLSIGLLLFIAFIINRGVDILIANIIIITINFMFGIGIIIYLIGRFTLRKKEYQLE